MTLAVRHSLTRPSNQCLSQDFETGCLKLAVVIFLGVQIFKGGSQYTHTSTINMYKFIKIRHDIIKQCHGNYKEMKKFNYELEIDIFRNSSIIFGCPERCLLRVWPSKKTLTPCWLRLCVKPWLAASHCCLLCRSTPNERTWVSHSIAVLGVSPVPSFGMTRLPVVGRHSAIFSFHCLLNHMST